MLTALTGFWKTGNPHITITHLQVFDIFGQSLEIFHQKTTVEVFEIFVFIVVVNAVSNDIHLIGRR